MNSIKKVALITGVTGQDGSYLAELLIKKQYTVHGLVRRTSTLNRERIEHLHSYLNSGKNNLILHYSDMVDSSNIFQIIQEIKPDEIYHLAAQSHVKISFELPEYSSNVDGLGTLRLLEAVKNLNLKCKIFNAATSELYSGMYNEMQSEKTPFLPQSPYAIAKLFSYHIARMYREAYGIFISNGILFNHESPRRGENFVTRKITIGIANILAGKQDKIILGNLDSKRDWGYSPDYVEAMWMMLQQEKPDDYIIATGETHSVRDFVQVAFKQVGINLEWKGQGIEEVGIDNKTGKTLVDVSPIYYRPLDVNFLQGDASKALVKFGWKPKVRFEELVKIMVKADLEGS
jgi:GDPmannose 4,6-dehydratase